MREGDWIGSWSIKLNSAFSITRPCCEAVVDGGYSFSIWFLRYKGMVLREKHIWFSASYRISQKAIGEITRLPKERKNEKRNYGERENIWFTWLVLLSKLSEIQWYLLFFFFLFQQNFDNMYIRVFFFFFKFFLLY